MPGNPGNIHTTPSKYSDLLCSHSLFKIGVSVDLESRQFRFGMCKTCKQKSSQTSSIKKLFQLKML